MPGEDSLKISVSREMRSYHKTKNYEQSSWLCCLVSKLLWTSGASGFIYTMPETYVFQRKAAVPAVAL